MTPKTMTSMERVLTTLGHKEPDRVPFFLLTTMHGAKELGMGIREYFSKAENVAKGQLRMRAKYRHDCLYGIFYAAIEIEAWGGEVIFFDNGPANAGAPVITRPEQIRDLEPPDINKSPRLLEVLKAIEMLKSKAGDEVPIIGVVLSPFSVPIIQMGFDHYIELMYERPDLFERLMKVNEEFCVQWANAQLKAGAAAIGYFDPVSSPGIIPREIYLKTGFPVAQRTIARMQGPTAIHFASDRCLPILGDVAQTGTAMVGVSVLEDLSEIKASCKGKIAVLGNLNGIEMRRWSEKEAEKAVKEAIAKAGPGGGYILSDNHGEIPWQVPDEVIMAISEAVHKWGKYPLNWVESDDGFLS